MPFKPHQDGFLCGPVEIVQPLLSTRSSGDNLLQITLVIWIFLPIISGEPGYCLNSRFMPAISLPALTDLPALGSM